VSGAGRLLDARRRPAQTTKRLGPRARRGGTRPHGGAAAGRRACTLDGWRDSCRCRAVSLRHRIRSAAGTYPTPVSGSRRDEPRAAAAVSKSGGGEGRNGCGLPSVIVVSAAAAELNGDEGLLSSISRCRAAYGAPREPSRGRPAMRVHWRWRAYLGLNGGPEAKALFLAVGQAHVPVPAQIAFHLPDSPVGEPRHVHRLCPGEQGRRHCPGAGWPGGTASGLGCATAATSAYAFRQPPPAEQSPTEASCLPMVRRLFKHYSKLAPRNVRRY
jgi:hypothetical protein